MRDPRTSAPPRELPPGVEVATATAPAFPVEPQPDLSACSQYAGPSGRWSGSCRSLQRVRHTTDTTATYSSPWAANIYCQGVSIKGRNIAILPEDKPGKEDKPFRGGSARISCWARLPRRPSLRNNAAHNRPAWRPEGGPRPGVGGPRRQRGPGEPVVVAEGHTRR